MSTLLTSHCHPSLTAKVLADLRTGLNVSTVEQFMRADPIIVAKKCKLTEAEIEKIRQELFLRFVVHSQSGFDLLRELKRNSGDILTGIQEIDNSIRFCLGKIYEIYGQAGCGKTQLALTLTAICASRTTTVSDRDQGTALYFDAKNDFSLKRLTQIISERYPNANLVRSLENVRIAKIFDVRTLIKRLEYVCSILDGNPPEILDSFWKRLQLIVIDSIASLVLPSMGREDALKRVFADVDILITLLRKLSSFCGVCILVTNHATTGNLFGPSGVADKNASLMSSSLRPSLGKIFSNGAQVRLWIRKDSRSSKCRLVQLQKSFSVCNKKDMVIQIGSRGWEEAP